MGLSAKRLGEKIGLTAEQTNTLLKDAGFQTGEPGNYIVSEAGKKFVENKSWWNGYGGYASRGYDYNEWDEGIIKKLNITSKNLERIRKITAENRRTKKISQSNINTTNIVNCTSDTIKNNKNNHSVIGILIIVFSTIITLGLIWFFKKKKNKNDKKEREF